MLYFDVVDVEEFLPLFVMRGDKVLAFVYMNAQGLFSCLIFLNGIALKTVM